MPLITTANVACGFHGGDPLVMRKTVALAHENGVAVGAHPGLPDLVGFGRRRMDITPDDAYAMVVYQVGALKAFLEARGHGAPPRQAAWRALRHAPRPGGGRRRRRRGDPRHLSRRPSSTGRRRSRCMRCRARRGSSASTSSARSISTSPIPTRRSSSSSARRRAKDLGDVARRLRRYLARGRRRVAVGQGDPARRRDHLRPWRRAELGRDRQDHPDRARGRGRRGRGVAGAGAGRRGKGQAHDLRRADLPSARRLLSRGRVRRRGGPFAQLQGARAGRRAEEGRTFRGSSRSSRRSASSASSSTASRPTTSR